MVFYAQEATEGGYWESFSERHYRILLGFILSVYVCVCVCVWSLVCQAWFRSGGCSSKERLNAYGSVGREKN